MSKNAGLEAAHGDYVWFVDSDDRIQPAPVLSRLDEFTEDMIVFGAWQDGDMFEQFENYGLVPSKLYRRSFLIENDIRFSESYSSEDNFFALQTSELHQTRRVISEQIYEVVLTPNSISRGPFNPKFVTRWKAVGDILDFARKHPREGLEKLERYCIFLSLGLTWSYYLERGRVRELLWSMPKFVSKLSEWGLLDQISVFLSSGSRKNRLLKRTAYLLSGGWRSVGSGRSLSG